MKNKLLYLLSLLIIITTSCDIFDTKITQKDIHFFESTKITEPQQADSIHIMNWNVKFGGGRINFFFDCIDDRVNMHYNEVIENLHGIKGFIKATNPDILFVQEIDLDSKRAAYINQVEWILENSDLNYAIYAPQWKSKYIPSKRIGKMNSGIAIFSKYPLADAEIINLPLIKEQNPIVRYFYLKRIILQCDAAIGDENIKLLNTHLEAYSYDGTKRRQLDIVYELISKLDKDGKTFILAGDTNCLPPHSEMTKNFPDSHCTDEFLADDYSQETDWMAPFYEKFHSAVPLEFYKENNQQYFTHTIDPNEFWSRKLDYIFSNKKFIENSDITWQSKENGGIETMPLSDHCAVSVKLGI